MNIQSQPGETPATSDDSPWFSDCAPVDGWTEVGWGWGWDGVLEVRERWADGQMGRWEGG
jgi:hypothetical protein